MRTLSKEASQECLEQGQHHWKNVVFQYDIFDGLPSFGFAVLCSQPNMKQLNFFMIVFYLHYWLTINPFGLFFFFFLIVIDVSFNLLLTAFKQFCSTSCIMLQSYSSVTPPLPSFVLSVSHILPLPV